MKIPSLLILLATLPCSAAPAPYLHVNAAAQVALRNKAALPPLAPGQTVDIALGTRGEEVVALTSPIVAQRPVFRTDGSTAFLRFDGENDFLSVEGPRKLSPAATVFVVAAPRKNPGYYRGFFALSEFGKNDYTSGLNLDLGPNATDDLNVVNVESGGAQGFRDLLSPGFFNAAPRGFGAFHVFTVRSQIKPGGNEAWLDGLPLTPRDRLESNIGFDQFVLGARYYSNDPAQQPFIDSFLHGDIAEVLVFDQALTDADRKDIEDKLLAKLPALNALASGKNGHALEVLKDAPPVQMLVPGFSVSELPVKLTNRNNLRYRHDGKLVALGYDGTIHLLTDTDGDGMEDKAEVFWDKPTMRGPLGIALLPKDDPRGDGVIVPNKGKVSLILDRDRDGRADEEIIVASGWKEIPQNVDAVGVAVDPKDGSIYFGLGCTNFANAYLIDPATGKAGYDLKAENGTIQKVSADFKTRTTVCTGVRFTCALGFNREGDLFATEQEGATWLPNGNPLDELLHIQPGKHYGFPPRHPKHLPDVLDWPTVVEYGPQHQSTVGMCFNESVNGGPTFGPDFWAGDALVCGEARGKLYRTKLVKTPHGYVGQNHLIACLGLLTVDACVSPAGDLLVACHSGPPDWGTGPKGDGHLFKIRYTGKDLPQPVWQWASAPDEFRIAFDRELAPADWAGLVARASGSGEPGSPEEVATSASGVPPAAHGVNFAARGGLNGAPGSSSSAHESPAAARGNWPSTVLISSTTGEKQKKTVRIEAGRYVSAGDRFEVIRPGYQVVRDQMAAPRRDVEVLGLSLSADRRTIIIRVPRQTEPVGYAVTLPLPESWRQDSAIPQKPEMDVLVTLNGVLSRAFGRQSGDIHAVVVSPSGSLLSFVEGSADHRQFGTLLNDFELNKGDDKIHAAYTTVHTGRNPFTPSIQPGAALDWQPPMFLESGAFLAEPQLWYAAKPYPVEWRRSQPVTQGTGTYPGTLTRGIYETPAGKVELPVPLSELYVPWAELDYKSTAGGEAGEKRAALPGDWLAGRRVFFSNEAACFTCHQIRGEGIAVGPDLTNLIHRDAESVLADVLNPSATINPDHPASTVTLKSGAKLTGIVRTANAQEVKVALQGGAVQTLAAADVAGTELLKTSFMPEGYAERLTKDQQRDLLKFLLESPLEPAPVERTDPPLPPARKRAEVDAVLDRAYGANRAHTAYKPLRVLLAAGPKDHGPGEHDYPLWQKRWATLLALAPGVTVDTSWEFPIAEKLAAADVTVFYSKNPGFNPRTAMLLDDYQNRGGGLVYLHWALNGDEHAQVLAERIGLAGGGTGVAYRHGEFDLVFTQPEHPVTKGFPTLHFTDETYWKLVGNTARINILGTGVEEGAPQPQLWSMERGKGRVIGCVPGHYTWTFDDPLYRALVLRAICWTAQQDDMNRLAELATVGARVAE